MTFEEQMTKDLDIFLETEEFAVSALYEGNSIDVQFTNSYDSETEAFYKMLWCKASAVPGIDKLSRFDIDGTTYGVVDFNVDEFGDGISIYLSEEL